MGEVGSPEPTSRYWLTPAAAIFRTESTRNARFARASTGITGIAATAFSAASPSTGKLSFPPGCFRYPRPEPASVTR
ncbi:MAG TPA: hypothetical protein VIL16_27380 [Trebonia sp.]